MSSQDLDHEFVFRLPGSVLGRLFMPRAATFEVLRASIIQESFVVDSVDVESGGGRCRLSYSEWEEDAEGDAEKLWISEYAIELAVDDVIAYGTYSLTLTPEQRDSGYLLDRLRRDAENDFMLCAKLLGRSVRRDLVVDEDAPTSGSQSKLH